MNKCHVHADCIIERMAKQGHVYSPENQTFVCNRWVNACACCGLEYCSQSPLRPYGGKCASCAKCGALTSLEEFRQNKNIGPVTGIRRPFTVRWRG